MSSHSVLLVIAMAAVEACQIGVCRAFVTQYVTIIVYLPPMAAIALQVKAIIVIVSYAAKMVDVVAI